MKYKKEVHIDFTKPPKFVINIFNFFKKIKLKRYKSKKVKEEKSLFDRFYFIKFRVKIEDDINPHYTPYFNIVVTDKAAFFAKINLKKHVLNNIELDFDTIEEMNDAQFNEFKESEEEFISKQYDTLDNTK